MLTAFTELYGRDFFRLPPFFLGLVEILCEIFFCRLAGWLGYRRYHLNKLPLDEADDWIIWIRLGIVLIKYWLISFPTGCKHSVWLALPALVQLN